MGEIRLDNFCRLCLKESFTLSNIFSSHSPSGDLLYRVLNFVYDLKILPDDVLPPKICAPCLWKMFEFDTYKKNVHFAEAEIVKFLGETRLDSNNRNDEENDETTVESDSTQTANNGISSKQGINTDYMKAQENEMNRASEDRDSEHGEHADDMLSIKDEMDIEEWEMPKEKTNGVNVVGVPIKEELDIVESEIPREIVMQWEKSESDASKSSKATPKAAQIETVEGTKAVVQPPVATPPSTRSTNVNKSTSSSDLKNFPSLEASEGTARKSFEGKSSSICTSQDNSIEIRHTNKMINEKDLRADVVPEEESSGLSKSILNDTKSEVSHLRAHVSMSLFVCDICKKCFKTKQCLGCHVRVHNNERSFSCNVCDKTFRQDSARYMHELRHMRDKIRFGKSEKGNKKKQHSCAICGKNFSTKGGLCTHSNLHRDKYKCNSCGKCSGSTNDLKRHLRTYTEEKPFKCEVCSKCFCFESNLRGHLRTHSSEKPFSCDICYKRFKSKHGKTQHELRHLGKK